jgi:murein DD-endopeptidase MepM/ murein hydrolase activator NlpD
MKPLVAILCVALLIFASLPADAQRKKKSSTQLRKELRSLHSRKTELRHELLKARKLSKGVREDITTIDGRLRSLRVDLNHTKQDLDESEVEQSRLKVKLDAAKSKSIAMRGQVRQRIRYIYMHQGESVLSSFIGIKSVGEIASRKFVMESVAKKDRALFDQFAAVQAEVAVQKKASDRVVNRIADLKDRQLDYQARMEVTREDKADTLVWLRQRQAKITNLLSQLEQDENSMEAQIRAFEVARRRRPGAKPLPAFNGRFMRPVSGRITSTFGMRYHPILHRTRLHAGIDFGASSGSTIVAAAAGEVITARYSRSYGNMVVIDHGGGISTLYAHGSRLYVHTGQMVKRGQRIAAVGSTGLATGPHLHWEVRRNGRPVNPGGKF